MKTQYTADNTIVCIAGNVSVATAVKKVKKYFSKIRENEIIKKAPVIEDQSSPNVLVENRNTDQTHFCLGVRAYNIFHPDKYVLELLSLILGGMMSSRLFVEVREKLGLAYYVKTEVSSDPDTGFLVSQAGVDNTRVELAIKAILKEYDKLKKVKISAKELKKAKDHFKGKMALLFEASDAQASFYGAQDLLEKKILTPSQIYAKIDKVSVNDIQRVSKDIFKPEKLNLTLIGPTKSNLKDLLWIVKKY
jgi:predicted Zn-dependent peptidase